MLSQQLQLLAHDFQQTELDLSVHRQILTDELLTPLLVNASKNLKVLVIDSCTKLTPNILHVIAANCPNLVSISTKNLPWKKWSTYGYFNDSRFPELLTIHIDGCHHLTDVYITAPKLQNVNHIVEVIHTQKFRPIL